MTTDHLTTGIAAILSSEGVVPASACRRIAERIVSCYPPRDPPVVDAVAVKLGYYDPSTGRYHALK